MAASWSIASVTPSPAATSPRRSWTPTGCAARSEPRQPARPTLGTQEETMSMKKRDEHGHHHLVEAVDTPDSSAAFKRRFMWRLLAVLIGGMLLDGYILGIIGPVTGPMKDELGMSTWELGLVASAALFGILYGSQIGGWDSDTWGTEAC